MSNSRAGDMVRGEKYDRVCEDRDELKALVAMVEWNGWTGLPPEPNQPPATESACPWCMARFLSRTHKPTCPAFGKERR